MLFNWLGGDIGSPSSWSPQPDPPAPPVVPGASDTASFGLGGTLTGSLAPFDVYFTAGAYSFGAAALSAVNLIYFSYFAGNADTSMTLLPGAQLDAGQAEIFGGAGVADITQTGGSNVMGAFESSNGSTYTLEDGSLSVSSFMILGTFNLNGSCAYVQNGGTADIGGMELNHGSATLTDGQLSVGPNLEYIGDSPGFDGGFTQTGGTHTITTDMSLGFGGTGTYLLQGGTLTSQREFIGQNSTGTFTQTSGTHSVSNRIVLGIDLTGGVDPIGHGTYTLGGDAALSVQTLFIGSDPNCVGLFDFNPKKTDTATISISGTGGFPGIIAGGEGHGKFVQHSGTVDSTLVVARKVTGDGTYDLRHGSFISTSEAVGGVGKGKFIQRHGTNHATGAGLDIGVASTAKGTYRLGRGQLTAASETIGDLGRGAFHQGDGRNTASGNLVIGKGATAHGTYRLGGTARLSAAVGITLGAASGATGSLAFNTKPGDAARVTFGTGTLTIGDGGSGRVVQGAGNLIAPLVLAAQAGSVGSYLLKAGVLGGKSATIGQAGTATFTQEAGTNALAASGPGLTLATQSTAHATYRLKGGTLRAPSETIADAGTALLRQTAGSNTVTTGNLTIGRANNADGTYDLSGGALLLTAGDLVLGIQSGATGRFQFDTTKAATGTLLIHQGVLTVGDAGDGSFIQGGGTLVVPLTLGASTGGTGAYELSHGTLETKAADQVIGDAGTGTFTQKSGSNLLTSGDLVLGASTGGTGIYTLGGKSHLTLRTGTLVLASAGGSHASFAFNTATRDRATLKVGSGIIDVGSHGSAQFTQGGGKLHAKLIVGAQVGAHGTYDLVAGRITAHGQTIGNDGTGLFRQHGGKNTISGGDLLLGAFSLGNGTYELHEGKLSAGGLIVGNDGAGSFVQTGGHTTLHSPTAALGLALNPGSTGTFVLAHGKLAVGTKAHSGQEVFGGAGIATFTQSGGKHSLSGPTASFVLGDKSGGSGTYDLHGGSFKLSNAVIGQAGNGMFSIGGKASAKLGGMLLLGAEAGASGTLDLNTGLGDVAHLTIAKKSLTVGALGSGTVTQGGGTAVAEIAIATGVGSTGTYSLQHGKLTAPDETIGALGTGTFVQTGGINTIRGGTLGIGGSGSGTYELSGGSLAVVPTKIHPDARITLGGTAGLSGILDVTAGRLAAPALTIGSGGRLDLSGGLSEIAGTITLAPGGAIGLHGQAKLTIGHGITPIAHSLVIGRKGDLMGAGRVAVDVVVKSGGTLAVTGGMRILGSLTGPGDVILGASARLTIDDAVSSRIDFTASPAATLRLGQPTNFAGAITGLALGDTIDLAGLTITAAQVSAHTLHAVTDTATTIDIPVSGDLTGHVFLMNPDGVGGTNLVLGTPLFTSVPDTVDFNALTPAQSAAIAGGQNPFAALAGDDSVKLPAAILWPSLGWPPAGGFDGGAGDDTIVGNTGADTILGNGGADSLTGAEGADLLRGEGGNDTLTGDAGDDTLDGGPGTNALSGGAGNDTYLITGRHDSITETPGGGDDTARSTAPFFTLPDNVETLILDGTADIDGTGNALANTLTGNSGANALHGGDGDDTLDGGLGDDTLAGGAGNDAYTVDSTADVVHEALGAGEDTISATVDYTLPANVEDLNLFGSATTGIGNALANHLTGTPANNTLIGGGGNDTLNGNGGDDTLTGGKGADVFVIPAAGAMEITDFLPGTDSIDVTAAPGITSYADLHALMHKSGTSVILDFGAGHTLQIDHTTIAKLDAHSADWVT